MTKQSLEKRITALEQLIGKSDILAVRQDASKTVRVTGTGEELELGEFWSKYPDATLFHVVHKDTHPDVVVSWDEPDMG